MEGVEAALATDDPSVLRTALKKAQAALRQAREADQTDQKACRCDELVTAQQAAAAASKVGGSGGGGSGGPPLMFSLEQLQESTAGGADPLPYMDGVWQLALRELRRA